MLINPEQVKMHRLVRDRVELDVLGNNHLGLALVGQGHPVAHELAAQKRLAELVALHRNRNGGQGTTVKHAGNIACAANFTGAASAGTAADFNIQNDLGHGHALKTKPPRMVARRRSDE